MKVVNNTLRAIEYWWRRGIDPASLQLRLTLGITVLLLLGLSGIGIWTTWEMRQMLIVKHQKHLANIADRLAQDIATSDPEIEPDMALQAAIDRWSSQSLRIWVKQPDGDMVARSTALAISPDPAALMSLSKMPARPEIFRIDGEYWIACSRPLRSEGQLLGWSFLAQNITHDYTVLLTLIRSLKVAIVLAVISIVISISLFVWRLLHPLRRVGQLVESTTQPGWEPAAFNPGEVPSEVKELVQTCSKLSDRLWETGQQQRDFTNNISHELRTSLSVVYGYLQSTLRRGSNLSAPQKEAIEIAVSEIEQTIQLLQDLLNLARTDSGSIPFQVEPLTLSDVIADAIAAVEHKHPVIQVEASAIPIIVMGDRTHLTQVLIHLIDNAIHYSYSEQPITIKLNQSKQQATIQVCDRGCGIPSSQQGRIFEPFYRVDQSRSKTTGGSGLGLAIAKSLVVRMGGQISVWSEPGQGSTFTVTLPLRSPQPKALKKGK